MLLFPAASPTGNFPTFRKLNSLGQITRSTASMKRFARKKVASNTLWERNARIILGKKCPDTSNKTEDF